MIKVEGYDNSGDNEVAFGFVYFNDGKRVVYTSLHGVTADTGGWPGVSPRHVTLADAYLQEKGVLK